MRFFFGTAIPGELAHDLLPHLEEYLRADYWRVAPIQQWHVTTLFIGEREERLLPILEQVAEKVVASTPPFTLIQGRLVTMPKERPAMLWVRFQPHEILTRMQMALAAATGTPPSVYRPYWPHITIARAKAGVLLPVQGPVILPSLTLDHITLFHSSPSALGTVHTPLKSWPLSGTVPVDHGAVL